MNMSRLHIAICAIAASVAVGCTNYGGNYFPDDRPTGGVDNGDDLAIINYIDQRLEEEYYWLDEVREKSATFNRRLPWEEYLKASLSKLTTNSDDGYYNHNGTIRDAIDAMYRGFNGAKFDEVANSLRYVDQYMCLADFESYRAAQAKARETYKDVLAWNKMSLANIAGAGIFSADRAVTDYARDIWHCI